MALAWAFVSVGAITLYLAAPTPALTLRHLIGLVGVWTVSWGSGYLLLRARLPQGDLLLIPPVALMTGWGLLLLARTAPGFLLRQLVWLALSVSVLCGVALFSALPRLLRRYRYTFLAGGLALLAATLIFGVNPSGVGARLWLNAGGLYFQPSELLKILFVIYLAAYLADRRDMTQTRGKGLRLWPAALGPMLLMLGLALVLLAWQEDLGAALLFYLTFLAMLYLAWGRLWHILAGLVLFAPVAIAGSQLSAHVALRVSIWLNPWAPEQADRAFQILQSLFALAAGGLGGEGLGLGRPTLIPAVHTDFVYAALTTEFGAAGALALLALLALFIQRGLRLAQRSKSPFESLLAGGIAALIGVQTWVIVAGNIKLIPITGVTLPFLSYGGSSLITMLSMVGLLLNLSAPHPLPLSLTLSTYNNIPPLKHTVERLGAGLFLLLAAAAVVTGVWTVIRAEALREYPSNSHRILDELRIRRGRITDRRGVTLADSVVDAVGYVTRSYPVPEAAPVVGYATLEYGTDGIEATCDATLRGDVERTARERAWMRLTHTAPTGNSVRLTLDARLQRFAAGLLAGQKGAAVLVDAHTGEILALASAPTYDPAAVAETWEVLRNDPNAPLLNRATQGLAQPGASLETVILGAALSQGLSLTVKVDAPVSTGALTLTCRYTPTEATWTEALAANCPAPFAEVGAYLGAEGLATVFDTWGLTIAPRLAIPAVAADWDMAADAVLREAVGQGDFLVTPLHMVGVAATLGNDGVRPPLHLLSATQPGCALPPNAQPVPVLDAELNAVLRAHWTHWGEAIGHLGIAYAGPERRSAWFMGLNSEHVARYAVAVLLENPTAPEEAVALGVKLLERAVNPDAP